MCTHHGGDVRSCSAVSMTRCAGCPTRDSHHKHDRRYIYATPMRPCSLDFNGMCDAPNACMWTILIYNRHHWHRCRWQMGMRPGASGVWPAMRMHIGAHIRAGSRLCAPQPNPDGRCRCFCGLVPLAVGHFWCLYRL